MSISFCLLSDTIIIRNITNCVTLDARKQNLNYQTSSFHPPAVRDGFEVITFIGAI